MSPSPSYTSTSTPSGARSRAAYARAVLNDSRRKLPERARIFIGLRGPRRREVRLQRHFAREEEATAGKRGVPLEAEVGAVDRPRELETDALVPPRIVRRAA